MVADRFNKLLKISVLFFAVAFIAACDSSSSGASNNATANAGADQSVGEGALVTLDGSGSTGNTLSYSWSQTAGTTVTLSSGTDASPTFTAPLVMADEVLSFELTVTDSAMMTSTDNVDITITNDGPTANAGPDQTVVEGAAVALDGSASSHMTGGTIVTYAWVQTAGTPVVNLVGTDTPAPTFTTALVMADETVSFELTVTDDDGDTDTDTVDIAVQDDVAPTANAGVDQTVNEGAAVTLDGSASMDAVGTIVSYAWIQTAGQVVALTGADTAMPTFTAPQVLAAGETLTFQLTVTDNAGQTGTDLTDVLVQNVNQAPTANAGPDQSVLEQILVNLTGAASTDIDGTIAAYQWTQTAGPMVSLTGADTATPSFIGPTVDAAGTTLTFELQVTDNEGATAVDTVNVQINNDPLLNDPPVANAGPDQTVDAAVVVTLDGSASTDSDGTIVAYQWTQTAGAPTVTLTNANTAMATFTSPAAPAVLTFELLVTDSDTLTATDTVVITVNEPPVANAGPDQTVVEQTAVNLTGAGSTDDGTIVSFAWVQTAGTTTVTLNNANTATPDFTAPTVGVAGDTLTFQLTVTDNDGATNADTVNIQVDNNPALNIPPVTNAGPDQSVGQGVTVTLDGSASTDDSAIISYAWTQTVGTTVVLSDATAIMPTFTSPATDETLTFQLLVTDDEGGSTPDLVDIVVSGAQNVSGKVTFSEIPHAAPGLGLDYASIVDLPARLVTVELIDSTDGTTVVGSTKTDVNGDYSVTVNPNIDVFVRVRAEMVEAGPGPSWNFSVVDNTNADAQYVLDTTAFNTGTASVVMNVLAETAFNGTDYTVRNGAPFAILDATYDAFQTVLAADATIDFVPLMLHWSINNTTASGDESIGEIGTSFYRGGSPIDGVYLLGDEDVDTEEYDQHVVIHEWGHYFEDTIARSDNIGGRHASGDVLDIRVAFGEGFGDAWSGIATGDPLYLDTFSTNQGVSGGFNVENGVPLNGANPTPGYYSERSVQEILYDLVDSTDDGSDTLSLGFTPLYNVFINQQSSTTAFTSVFSFIDALKSDLPANAAAIDALLASQSISTVADEYGTGEANDAGSADTLPIYKTLTVNGPAVNVCSTTEFGTDGNKLNTIQFLRLTLATPGALTFTATATVIPAGETTDPDLWLRRPPANGIFEVFESTTANSETGVSQNLNLVGENIIEVFDFNNRGSAKLLPPNTQGGPTIGRACFDVTVTQ